MNLWWSVIRISFLDSDKKEQIIEQSVSTGLHAF